MSYADALREEEDFKEKIYTSFDAEIKSLQKKESDAENYYESGAYESQYSFIAANSLKRARKERYIKEQQINALYSKPYFAHIRMRLKKKRITSNAFFLIMKI